MYALVCVVSRTIPESMDVRNAKFIHTMQVRANIGLRARARANPRNGAKARTNARNGAKARANPRIGAKAWANPRIGAKARANPRNGPKAKGRNKVSDNLDLTPQDMAKKIPPTPHSHTPNFPSETTGIRECWGSRALSQVSYVLQTHSPKLRGSCPS